MPRLVTALLLALAATAPALAQDFDPALFETRDFYKCGPYTEALPGGPSAAELSWILVCGEEAYGTTFYGRAYFFEDVAMVRDPERRPLPHEMLALDLVLERPVYPFHGTLTQISCATVSDYNRGASCNETPQQGTGFCYYNAKDVWVCAFAGATSGEIRSGVPPRAF